MVKDAFKRLPIERRTAVMDSAMALYLEKPNDEITIRVLAAHLGINMATFYRWFDDKYDLCIEIARFICVKAAPTEPRHIFDEFDTSDVVTKREAEYMTRIVFCNDELRQRVFFDVDVDVVLFHAGQFGMNEKGLGLFGDVHADRRGINRTIHVDRTDEETAEKIVKGIDSSQLVHGYPPNECEGLSSFPI